LDWTGRSNFIELLSKQGISEDMVNADVWISKTLAKSQIE